MERKVVPSMELLSEMESLEIHGGVGLDQNGTDDITYRYCSGAKCSNCACTGDPKTTECSILYVYCGAGTICGK